ncbi:hypothetical protein TcCL_NonESM09731, partial [Trypanosoma cruzi]
MHAKFHYSATPFKLLPKQSASDTVIGHTLPVDCRGKDAVTKGSICTNVGSINSQHRHTTHALSVHPTSRLKRPRQAPINKIMRRRKQIPCRHFRAPQQRQQQERASLRLQQCRPLCSRPLGALSTTRPSRAHKTSRTQMPFIFSANGVAALNHLQIIHNSSPKVSFHCHKKKRKNVLKNSTQIPLRPTHCALPRTGSFYSPSALRPSHSCLP